LYNASTSGVSVPAWLVVPAIAAQQRPSSEI
jgi:hypothetical protein